MSAFPDYVEYGLRSTSAGPFRCSEGHMRLLILEGREEPIAALTETALTGPAGGAAAYRPLGRRVLLITGTSRVESLSPPWNEWGRVPETLASFWVPLVAGRPHNGRLESPRLCMWASHVFVDNPWSLVAGREIYGYAKALGRFCELEGGVEEIRGFGGNFGQQAEAGWVPVLRLKPAGGSRESAADLAETFARELLGDDHCAAELGLPDVLKWLVDVFRKRVMRQVFLKQVRDAKAQRSACYQAVVEADAQLTHVAPALAGQDWDIEIEPVDSHPIPVELGLPDSQRARWGVELRELDFVVGEGDVIGP